MYDRRPRLRRPRFADRQVQVSGIIFREEDFLQAAGSVVSAGAGVFSTIALSAAIGAADVFTPPAVPDAAAAQDGSTKARRSAGSDDKTRRVRLTSVILVFKKWKLFTR
jgi:hypothetical protein